MSGTEDPWGNGGPSDADLLATVRDTGDVREPATADVARAEHLGADWTPCTDAGPR